MSGAGKPPLNLRAHSTRLRLRLLLSNDLPISRTCIHARTPIFNDNMSSEQSVVGLVELGTEPSHGEVRVICQKTTYLKQFKRLESRNYSLPYIFFFLNLFTTCLNPWLGRRYVHPYSAKSTLCVR
jgi:hypothetical protein